MTPPSVILSSGAGLVEGGLQMYAGRCANGDLSEGRPRIDRTVYRLSDAVTVYVGASAVSRVRACPELTPEISVLAIIGYIWQSCHVSVLTMSYRSL